MPSQLPRPYEPHPLLRTVTQRLFDLIQVDDAWVSSVRELSKQGSIVYVLRNLSFIDFFALEHLTRRHGLPRVRFANDLGVDHVLPLRRGWQHKLVRRRLVTDPAELDEVLAGGASAMLFLKRPPGPRDVVGGGASGARGLQEGEELLRGLLKLQAERKRPILLVPQVLVWTRRADTLGARPLDFFLGPRGWPGTLRTLGQFLQNFRGVTLRLGEPLNLADFIARDPEASEDSRVRRITYAMLRRLERERRVVTGPAVKPPDRVRDEIVRSPKVRAVVAKLAGENPADQAVLTARAYGMLRELQALPDASVVQALISLFDHIFKRIYAGIEWDDAEIERLRQAAKDGSLVLLPSHKSHIDYLVLSYVFHMRSLSVPVIAAGENLSFFPLGHILRRGGAFFIRRSFKGDRLYIAVVDGYIRRLMRDGFPIEVFIEGGRSRTGKLLPPKFGLLNMIVEAAMKQPQHKAYFVPVSIGYERIIESGDYGRELTGGEKKAEDAAGLLRSTDVLRHRYGRINLQFGPLLTVDQIAREIDVDSTVAASPYERMAIVTRLGNRVMDEINRVTAVTSGALTALALLSDRRRGIPHDTLLERCGVLLTVLRELDARVTPAMVTPTGNLKEQSIAETLQMFAEADFIEIHDAAGGDGKRRGEPAPAAGEGAIYCVVEKQRLELDTTKNIIVHFFVERGLVAVALRMGEGPPVPLDTLKERVFELSRLFKFEFRFRADATFDEIFDDTLAGMVAAGIVERSGRELVAGPGSHGWTGSIWISTYASIFRNFVEGYFVAARSLGSLVRGPATKKELVRRALATGRRMFLAGEIERPESISKPLIENAIRSFVDQKYLTEREERLELIESFRTPEAVKTIEGRIAAFLARRR